MPSPGNWRPLVERALRAASLVAMVVLAVRLWSGTTVAGETMASTAELDSSLVRWSAAAPAQVVVKADTLPSRRQRDWLVALRRTGSSVRWSATDSSGGALVVEGGPLPGSAGRVVALTAPSRVVHLADALGYVDSTTTTGDGVAVWGASPIGIASVDVGNAVATAAPRDSFSVRPVLVIGQVGWESRFVVTVLEESGWTVAARLSVAPAAIVRQGMPARIDTASISAVIVLDSVSAVDGGEISRFVRQGGGLVASGAGVRHPAVRSVLPPAREGSAGEIGALLGPAPRSGLSTRTFAAGAGSVPLERRGAAPVVVARRLGSGRALAIGYDDTWRLRMVPVSDNAPEAHRAWWSSLVGGVALVRPAARDVGLVDEAPFASTVSALGPATTEGPDAPVRLPWEVILGAVVGTGLLGEWLSRRLRGLA
jgi:hypothetical protein